jgi:hypothetical protein
MTKLVRIDELTYADLVHITGEMMAKLRKPWSLGMSVRMATAVLVEYMKTSGWEELLENLKKQEILSPEDWLASFEQMYRIMTADEG